MSDPEVAKRLSLLDAEMRDQRKCLRSKDSSWQSLRHEKRRTAQLQPQHFVGGKRKRRAVEARLFDGVGLVLGGFAGCDLVAG